MASFNSSTAPSECPTFNIHPGIRNATASNNIDNFSRVNPNTDESPNTKPFGAGSGPEFVGQRVSRRPGFNEHPSGIIESTNIDPLNENSNKDDGWANTTSKSSGPGGSSTTGLTNTASSATGFVAGVAKFAYGAVAGNEKAKHEGREAVYGSK